MAKYTIKPIDLFSALSQKPVKIHAVIKQKILNFNPELRLIWENSKIMKMSKNTKYIGILTNKNELIFINLEISDYKKLGIFKEKIYDLAVCEKGILIIGEKNYFVHSNLIKITELFIPLKSQILNDLCENFFHIDSLISIENKQLLNTLFIVNLTKSPQPNSYFLNYKFITHLLFFPEKFIFHMEKILPLEFDSNEKSSKFPKIICKLSKCLKYAIICVNSEIAFYCQIFIISIYTGTAYFIRPAQFLNNFILNYDQKISLIMRKIEFCENDENAIVIFDQNFYGILDFSGKFVKLNYQNSTQFFIPIKYEEINLVNSNQILKFASVFFLIFYYKKIELFIYNKFLSFLFDTNKNSRKD